MISIVKQDSEDIIKFDLEHFQETLEIVRLIQGRKYNKEEKYWSIPLEKLDIFCSSLDLEEIPFEITKELRDKPACVKQLQFQSKENKPQNLVYLRIHDQHTFILRLFPDFTYRNRLEPLTSSIVGDNLYFSSDNLWDVLLICKKTGTKVTM
jgi:hypothetical protein